ncbi:MAG: hypothetical protein ACO3DI_04920, partial [Ilumatobacteraceae bacterium]
QRFQRSRPIRSLTPPCGPKGATETMFTFGHSRSHHAVASSRRTAASATYTNTGDPSRATDQIAGLMLSASACPANAKSMVHLSGSTVT